MQLRTNCDTRITIRITFRSSFCTYLQRRARWAFSMSLSSFAAILWQLCVCKFDRSFLRALRFPSCWVSDIFFLFASFYLHGFKWGKYRLEPRVLLFFVFTNVLESTRMSCCNFDLKRVLYVKSTFWGVGKDNWADVSEWKFSRIKVITNNSWVILENWCWIGE